VTTLAPLPLPERTLSTAALPRVDPITRLPLLILFPHSRCNCCCLMCDIWRTTTRDEISAEVVAARLDEWRGLGVERTVLSGGEALMHSHLWELCAHLRRASIGITLLSTGLLLKRHARSVVQYCDDVVVSLDGPQATHDAIRNVPRAYERLAQGVHAVAAAAAERGVSVTLSARCTVQKQNYQQLRAVVRAARELGLARISFLAADVSTDAFNRPSGWDDDHIARVALTAGDLPLLQRELDSLEREHADDFASGFIAESAIKLRRRLYQYYAALTGSGGFFPNRCNAPWVSTVIESDGTVRPCFFQPPLGKLHGAESLLSILNSPQSLNWRAGLDIQRDAICRRCVCTLSLRADGQGQSGDSE
jgi:MoaA/NifB/PqqE/SkfB family radical SAM enzyme